MYARFKYKWRLTPLPVPPATVIIANRPRYEKGAAFHITAEVLDWIRRNNGEQEARYLLKDRSGWVNAYPMTESLTFGGNVAEVERIEGNFAKVVTLLPGAFMSLPAGKDNHLLVHKFTAVSPTNQPRLAGAGLHVYLPFIVNGDAWVSLDWVDIFTSQPEPLWPGGAPVDLAGYPAVVMKGTVVRQSPEGVKIFVTTGSLVVRVISEVNGWAKIGDKRWVELARVMAG